MVPASGNDVTNALTKAMASEGKLEFSTLKANNNLVNVAENISAKMGQDAKKMGSTSDKAAVWSTVAAGIALVATMAAIGINFSGLQEIPGSEQMTKITQSGTMAVGYGGTAATEGAAGYYQIKEGVIKGRIGEEQGGMDAAQNNSKGLQKSTQEELKAQEAIAQQSSAAISNTLAANTAYKG